MFRIKHLYWFHTKIKIKTKTEKIVKNGKKEKTRRALALKELKQQTARKYQHPKLKTWKFPPVWAYLLKIG